MPQKNGVVYCVNHPTTAMKNDGTLNVIPRGQWEAGNQFLVMGGGMPVKLFACELCSYVEIYFNPPA